MLDIIRGGEPLRQALVASLDKIRNDDSIARIPAADVRWYPPVRRPGKICAVAMNNSLEQRAQDQRARSSRVLLEARRRASSGIASRFGSARTTAACTPSPSSPSSSAASTRDVPATSALDAVYGYTIFNDITGNGMRAEDRFHYWAVYAKKDNPNETERVEQHLSYAGPLQRHRHVRRDGPVARHEGRDREPRRPDRDVQSRRRADRGGQHALLQLQGRRGRELHQPVPYAACPATSSRSARRSSRAQGRKSIHQANFQTVAGPVEVAIEGLGTQENPVVIEQKELGAWRLP